MKKWEERNNFSKNKLHCIMISFQIPFDWVIFCLLKIFRNQPLIVRQVWGVWLCTYFWSQPPTGEFNLCSKPVYPFSLQEWYLCIVHLSRDNKHKIDYGDLSILGWLNTHEFIFLLFFLTGKVRRRSATFLPWTFGCALASFSSSSPYWNTSLFYGKPR